MFSHKDGACIFLSGDEYSVLHEDSWETLSTSKLIVETFLLNATVSQVESITLSPSSSINDICSGILYYIKSLQLPFGTS